MSINGVQLQGANVVTHSVPKWGMTTTSGTIPPFSLSSLPLFWSPKPDSWAHTTSGTHVGQELLQPGRYLQLKS